MIDKTDLEFALWRDVFKCKSDLTPGEDSEEYVKRVVKATEEIYSKYEQTSLKDLACGLLTVVRDDLCKKK